MRSLTAKKAVFSEKPISHDPAELEQVLSLALSSRLVFVAGYQRRCDKNFRELKQQIDSGVIGTPRVIKCTSRDNPEPPIEYLQVSGGIFHDMLCHDFDMLHFLTGKFPEAVYSIGHCYNPAIGDMGDCDTVIVTLKFASGLLASVDTSRVACYGYDQRIEVLGEKGMAQANNTMESTVTVATSQGFLGPR
ncbi:hypothetical protein T492DRAFT_637449 [Pavlovales sp. CCMP2436]|nr:hypothetical protein T492DRAFT_637449 [Pavlovales sp. CCMP2436]